MLTKQLLPLLAAVAIPLARSAVISFRDSDGISSPWRAVDPTGEDCQTIEDADTNPPKFVSLRSQDPGDGPLPGPIAFYISEAACLLGKPQYIISFEPRANVIQEYNLEANFALAKTDMGLRFFLPIPIIKAYKAVAGESDESRLMQRERLQPGKALTIFPYGEANEADLRTVTTLNAGDEGGGYEGDDEESKQQEPPARLARGRGTQEAVEQPEEESKEQDLSISPNRARNRSPGRNYMPRNEAGARNVPVERRIRNIPNPFLHFPILPGPEQQWGNDDVPLYVAGNGVQVFNMRGGSRLYKTPNGDEVMIDNNGDSYAVDSDGVISTYARQMGILSFFFPNGDRKFFTNEELNEIKEMARTGELGPHYQRQYYNMMGQEMPRSRLQRVVDATGGALRDLGSDVWGGITRGYNAVSRALRDCTRRNRYSQQCDAELQTGNIEGTGADEPEVLDADESEAPEIVLSNEVTEEPNRNVADDRGALLRNTGQQNNNENEGEDEEGGDGGLGLI
ncbi:hypothetical protein ABW19_dt0209178 [Dactylella cylindrospora]|nr:hypothetical protein ABW19_dt0209178 [Dactylella cylindrospora]